MDTEQKQTLGIVFGVIAIIILAFVLGSTTGYDRAIKEQKIEQCTSQGYEYIDKLDGCYELKEEMK